MTAAKKALVVGTGIAGASCAYALARRGVEVVAIEAGWDGQATAASAGIIQPWSSAAEGSSWYPLYLAGADYYPTLIQRLSDDGVEDVGYSRTGSLVVSDDATALDDVETRVRSRAEDWPCVGDISRLTSRRARELFPPLAERLSAVHISGGARADGRKLRHRLLDVAQHHGVTLIKGAAELMLDGGHARGVRVNDEHIQADCVIAAAGAWTNRLLRPLGLHVPIEPQRGQIVHLRIDGVDTSHWPSVHPMSGHYLVCFDDSRIVVGASRETGSGFDVRVTAAGQQSVLNAALEVAPGLADASYIETRVGLRPLADDRAPHIGFVPGIDGLAVITGFGAAGLTMGPVVGEAVADLVHGLPPALDLTAFAPRLQ